MRTGLVRLAAPPRDLKLPAVQHVAPDAGVVADEQPHGAPTRDTAVAENTPEPPGA